MLWREISALLCWAESWCQHFPCRAQAEHVVSQLNMIFNTFFQITQVNSFPLLLFPSHQMDPVSVPVIKRCSNFRIPKITLREYIPGNQFSAAKTLGASALGTRPGLDSCPFHSPVGMSEADVKPCRVQKGSSVSFPTALELRCCTSYFSK